MAKDNIYLYGASSAFIASLNARRSRKASEKTDTSSTGSSRKTSATSQKSAGGDKKK